MQRRTVADTSREQRQQAGINQKRRETMCSLAFVNDWIAQLLQLGSQFDGAFDCWC